MLSNDPIIQQHWQQQARTPRLPFAVWEKMPRMGTEAAADRLIKNRALNMGEEKAMDGGQSNQVHRTHEQLLAKIVSLAPRHVETED
jgi:hypothetical protein